jgi:hypothetical protein
MDLSRDTALVGAESKDPGDAYLCDTARSLFMRSPRTGSSGSTQLMVGRTSFSSAVIIFIPKSVQVR